MNTNDSKKEFKDLKYILTSSMRTKLLITIFEREKNLEDLRNELNKPSATILHGLKELENLNYVKKVQKHYSLTSNGYLLAINMIKLIDNWYSINKNESFWNNHSLIGLPENSIKNIFLLKNSEYITSTNNNLSKALTTYMKLVKNSKNLRIILPIFSEIHLNTLLKQIDKNSLKSLEIITTNEIKESIEKHIKFSSAILKNKHITLKISEKPLNIFLTCCDSYISMNLFFKDGHYDDSQLLVDKSDEGIKWGNELYEYYANSAKK